MLRDGRTVHRHKGIATALALLMNGPGNEFFAGAGLAEDEHGGINPRDLLDLPQDLEQGGTAANDFAEIVLVADFLLQIGVLRFEPRFFLFHQNALTSLSWALVAVTLFYLYRTRPGLHLRAVGESPATADAMGVNVTAYRYVHVMLGGALAGIGGAFFSLAITPGWLDGMTSGAGWIAIALVIFAFWRPELALVGAYLFGAFSSLAFTLQARQVHLPPEVFSSLPYLMTIVVLVLVSTGWARQRLGAPAALGVPYVREER